MEIETSKMIPRASPSEWKGEELLLVNIFRHVYNLGEYKPKTLNKLKKCLEKWQSVIFVCKPVDLLKMVPPTKIGTDIVVMTKKGLGVDLTSVQTNLVNAAIKKSNALNCNVKVLMQKSTDFDHVVAGSINENVSKVIEKISLSKQLTELQTNEKVINDIVQSLMLHVSSEKKDAKIKADELLQKCVHNLQRFGFVNKCDSGAGDRINYQMPSQILMLSLKSLLEESGSWRDQFSFQGLQSLEQSILTRNTHLSQLKLTCTSDYDCLRGSIISGAVDALHKVKKKSTQDANDDYSSLFFELIDSYEGGALASGISATSSESHEKVSSYSSTETSWKETHDSTSDGDDSDQDYPTASKIRKLDPDQSTSSSTGGLQPSDGQPRQGSSDSVDLDIAKSNVLEQSGLVSKLLGLSIFDCSEEDHDDIETLLNCMKSLNVKDISKIPEDIDMETIACLVTLEKMGNSKPKTLPALINVLKPVCKFLYVMPPKNVKVLEIKKGQQQNKCRNPRDFRRVKPSDNEQIKFGEIYGTEKYKLTMQGFERCDDRSERKCAGASQHNRARGKVQRRGRGRNWRSRTHQPDPLHQDEKKDDGCDNERLYQILEKLLQYKVHKMNTTYVIASGCSIHGFEKNLQMFIKHIDQQNAVQMNQGEATCNVHFNNRKQLYEFFAKMCLIEKHYSADSLVDMLEEEQLIKVARDGTIVYDQVLSESSYTFNEDHIRTMFLKMLRGEMLKKEQLYKGNQDVAVEGNEESIKKRF